MLSPPYHIVRMLIIVVLTLAMRCMYVTRPKGTGTWDLDRIYLIYFTVFLRLFFFFPPWPPLHSHHLLSPSPPPAPASSSSSSSGIFLWRNIFLNYSHTFLFNFLHSHSDFYFTQSGKRKLAEIELACLCQFFPLTYKEKGMHSLLLIVICQG